MIPLWCVSMRKLAMSGSASRSLLSLTCPSCTSLAIAPASLCNSLPTRRYHRLLEINLQLHRHPRQCCWPPILVPSLSSFRCLEWSILGDPVLQLIKNYAVIKHMRSCIKANKTHDCQFRGSLSPLQWLTVTVTSIGITG